MFPSDILTIASKLVKITNEQTITLSTAESCTGGLIAGAITEIPGSSSIFHRGFVTYSNLAKKQVLNVQSYQLKKFGAVSEEVASQMAIGAKLNSNSDISVGMIIESMGDTDIPVSLTAPTTVVDYDGATTVTMSAAHNVSSQTVGFFSPNNSTGRGGETVIADHTIPAGATIYGRWTSLLLGAGRVIAYFGK